MRSGHSSGSKPKASWAPPSLEKMQALLPDYQFVALIGRGGMGAVYKAIQNSLSRPVAIKVLPEDLMDDGDATFAARFRQEALTMARLSHPGIVSVFAAGEAGGFLYIVMEFVDGTDVARMIESEGKLAPRIATKLLTQACDALEYAHRNNIVHRDIKPANLLLTRDGALKIADFGLAKQQGDTVHSLTRTNLAVGTPDFLAPEAWSPERQLDARADLYSVGVTLYQMLTGDIPRGFWEMPSAIAGTDARFDAIIERAMQPKPEARYQSSVELRRDLERIQAEPAKEAVEQNASLPRRRLIKRMAAGLPAGALALAWWRWGKGGPAPTMRDAARWLVKEKATFKVASDGVEFGVKTEADIPSGDFQIVYLWFDRWASTPAEAPPPDGEFEVLKAVNTLRLAFVRLPGISDSVLAFLGNNPELASLHVTCPERITDRLFGHIAGLKKLVRLELSHSPRVTGRGMAGSAWLNSIQELDLLYASVSAETLRVIAGCPKLRQIRLEGTSITADGLRALTTMRSLTSLNIGGCPNLSESDLMEILPQFHQLRRLELPNAALGEQVAEAVASLTNLTELHLAGPQVTDDVLAKLAPLTRLESLDLFAVKVTPAGMQAFERAHPRCRIRTLN